MTLNSVLSSAHIAFVEPTLIDTKYDKDFMAFTFPFCLFILSEAYLLELMIVWRDGQIGKFYYQALSMLGKCSLQFSF